MSLIPIILKRPEAAQLPAVVELDQLSLGGLWTLEGYQRELNSPNSGLFILMLPTLSEQVIGCGCYWAILEEAHITLLSVHPDYQGKGLGKLLLYTLLKDAVKRKLERATLEVRESNETALNLYQSFGFKVAGKRKKYYQDTGEDAMVLWRGDLHHPSFREQLNEWNKQINHRIYEQGFLTKSEVPRFAAARLHRSLH